MGCIPLLVASELGPPVAKIAARNPAPFATVQVPEASMHEYHRAKARENDVGYPRKRPHVNPKTVSHTMEALANTKLWFRVELPD